MTSRLGAISLAALLIGLVSPAIADEECMVSVAPDVDRGILGELMYYDFGPFNELQVDTPSQPSDIGFEVAIDGRGTSDVLAFAGLDDIVLSLANADAEIAIDRAFLTDVLDGNELTVLGYRDGMLVTFASYDLAQLKAGVEQCGPGQP